MFFYSTMVLYLGLVESNRQSLHQLAKPNILLNMKPLAKLFWLRGLLVREIGVLETIQEGRYPRTIAPPTVIYADNQGAIKLTENPEYHRKTKHIPIKYHKTRELVDDGTVNFIWIPTAEMVADCLTKSLGAAKLKKFVVMLGLVDR